MSLSIKDSALVSVPFFFSSRSGKLSYYVQDLRLRSCMSPPSRFLRSWRRWQFANRFTSRSQKERYLDLNGVIKDYKLILFYWNTLQLENAWGGWIWSMTFQPPAEAVESHVTGGHRKAILLCICLVAPYFSGLRPLPIGCWVIISASTAAGEPCSHNLLYIHGQK